jgi:anti-sigma factor RsiW
MRHDEPLHPIVESLTSAPDAGHLDAATQLIPYVDGQVDAADREIIESHLDDCAMCRAEVDDLRTMLARRPRATPWWIAFAAAAAVATTLFLAWPRPEPPIAVSPPPLVVRPAVVAPEPMAPAPPRYGKPEWQRLVDDAKRTGRLRFPAYLTDLAPPPDVLRGVRGSRDDELTPAGRVVDDARPELSWRARRGATYVVSVFDGETEVARSESLTSARWTVTRTLRRGRTYLWQVRVSVDGKEETIPALPAPPALFRITSNEEHRAIADARTQFPNDHLLHAVLYAKSGMREEAERALDRAQHSK